MKVIIFTADENNGGIKQFSIQLLKTCISLGWDTTLFIPDIDRIQIPESVASYVYRYRKQKDILGITPQIIAVAKRINNIKPDTIICSDDCMYSVQVMMWVKKNISKYITVHDVVLHPGRKVSIIRHFLNFLSLVYYRRIGFFLSKKVILLSNNSKERFSKRYPSFAKKAKVMQLGAHPPIIQKSCQPAEITSNSPFLLFFGRIEHYKGVCRLLKAYNKANNPMNYKLVVAGNGTLSEEETKLAFQNENIIVINRYITDSEMVWLFQNCLLLVLPYIEASQSGVIPMAYHYGKPVIASNIDGIREVVDDGNTGMLFDTDKELLDCLEKICAINPGDISKLSSNCYEYEKNNLDWGVNLKRLIEG